MKYITKDLIFIMFIIMLIIVFTSNLIKFWNELTTESNCFTISLILFLIVMLILDIRIYIKEIKKPKNELY